MHAPLNKSWFYLIPVVISILVIVVCSAVVSWQRLNSQIVSSNQDHCQLVAKSVSAYLNQLKIILNILVKQKQVTREFFYDLIDEKDSVTGFAVIQPDGWIAYTSSSGDRKLHINVLDSEFSRDSFLEALSSKDIVIGRTYRFKDKNLTGIPIRKAVYDGGMVKYVISVGAYVHYESWFNEGILNQVDIIEIFREKDFYRQIYLRTGAFPDRVYSTPLPKSEQDQLLTRVSANRKVLKAEQVFSFVDTHALDQQRYLKSFSYIPELKLWVGTYFLYDHLINQYIPILMTHIAVCILVLAGCFYAFWRIQNIHIQTQAQLIYQANHHPITHLPNRQYLYCEFDELVTGLERAFCFILLNINKYKNINDSHGEVVADHVLLELANRLQSVIPAKGHLIHLNADEFLLLLPKKICKKSKFLARLQNLLTMPYSYGMAKLNVSCRLGVVDYPHHGTELSELMLGAHIAMESALKEARFYNEFNPALSQAYKRQMLIEQSIAPAVEANEFYLVYQPQILRNGQIWGVEALLRWRNETLSNPGPDVFIPAAETLGQMPLLGAFVLEKALIDIKQLMSDIKLPVHLSVNISVSQLNHPEFIYELKKILLFTQFDPTYLTLEITESMLITEPEQTIKRLNILKTTGVLISMDDFGTGYSSLNMLAKLPIDELKIDKSFVDDVDDLLSHQKMIKNIIAIAKSYHMFVVAEGIEHISQYNILNQLGCDSYQGYYFAKPMSIDECIEYCRRKDDQSG
ncbi:EAL domain-containing protein [Gayadomonas joobiniege]|uniref:bifunctional diguanylate cyclase/phosphodiesterase n=1 Tax=Gayadomonas joobiniege TaxID=1234606 RepID=UPI0003739DC1|nr:EAL domain-containing protein [Gayadomonas joobiniege]